MYRITSILISLFCLCFFKPSYSQNSTPLIVETKQGKLQGTSDNGTLVWRGIPYAKAPIGDLRFKAPKPTDKWEGVKNATTFGPIAPQHSSSNADGKSDEDCLFLNIWSTGADTKKRPVMFWIHGGAFSTGAGSNSIYDGSSLAKKGEVVVVTINYRLGPLAFLYFDSIAPNNTDFDHNLGIQDQIAALKWVKENIEKFGGDPEQVTIFGQSSGATSVLTLMSIPSTKGLFKHAIAESPSLYLWTTQDATMVTEKFLALLGLPKNLLSELFTISADSLNQVAKRLLQDRGSMPSIGIFSPTIDRKLIVQHPLSSITAGNTKDVKLMIGTNKDEANLFRTYTNSPIPLTGKQMHESFAARAPNSENQITNTYPKYPKEQAVLSLLTDAVFRMPAIKIAEAQQKYTPTFMYRMDWASLPLKLKGLRSCHALELFFVFHSFKSPYGKKISTLANKKVIYKVADQIQTAWINFAKTGNPNTANSETWKPYSPIDRPTMIFDKKTKLDYDPNAKQRVSWGDIKLF